NLKSRHDNYLQQLLRTSSYGMMPAVLGNALLQYSRENEAKRAEMRPRIEGLIENYYAEFYPPLEQEILAAQLKLYAAKGAEYGLAPMVAELKTKNSDFTSFVNDAVSRSMFT